ncbi:hypothetical protein ACQR1W_32710, partial [Bradyrhizobium sp. HKCCYLS1011]|uniref:hypothetical protein n=1 Tax=Bradyrhizobium sp. HKCCYLS1011 TaxID=3420733 RepID=UPI003EBA4BEB
GRQPPQAVARLRASLEAGRSPVYQKKSCSPGTGVLAPVIGAMPSRRKAMSRSIVANLMSAPGHQDHTT